MTLKLSKVRFLIPILILSLLTSCGAKNGGKDASNATPVPTPVTLWGETESAISNALLGAPGGKCEWEMLGWQELERYIWAFCQSGPELNASGVSAPVKVLVNPTGEVLSTTVPEAGSNFSGDVIRMFPPAVQEKILAQDFDLYAATTRLEARWKSPTLPPLVYTQTREMLPTQGEQALPSISAASASRIVKVAELGKGNVKRVQYLQDGQVVLTGDRGFGFWQPSSDPSQFQFANSMDANRWVISPSGHWLAAIDDPVISVYDRNHQTELIRIDTSGLGGKIAQVQFLPDGLTIAVENIIPGEGPGRSNVALYSLRNGQLINHWWPGGSDF
ncbi:hypothetical protein EG834_16130, partial [bacterium]|nr:hypothetical protein [bacterium]